MSEKEKKFKIKKNENKPKKEKKPLSKDAKKIIKIAIVFAVIFAVVFGGRLGITIAASRLKDMRIPTKIIIALMPNKIEREYDGKTIEFYLEASEKLNTDKVIIDPSDYMCVYYNDAKGKRVDLKEGKYKTSEKDVDIVSEFFSEMLQKYDKLKLPNILQALEFIYALALIVFLIYIWYKVWCKKEDERIARNKAAAQARRSKE